MLLGKYRLCHLVENNFTIIHLVIYATYYTHESVECDFKMRMSEAEKELLSKANNHNCIGIGILL